MHAGIAKIAVSFEVSGGENVPGITGAFATRNFTYLVRGPCVLDAGSTNHRALTACIYTKEKCPPSCCQARPATWNSQKALRSVSSQRTVYMGLVECNAQWNLRHDALPTRTQKVKCVVKAHDAFSNLGSLSHWSDMMLSQGFHPMAAQILKNVNCASIGLKFCAASGL